MTSRLALAALLLVSAGAVAHGKVPPVKDPVFLNIGFVCQWQERCIARQQRAMRRALSYVRRREPPSWKVELCNRNASRRPGRVDWIGFDNCVRNANLRRPPATASRRR